MLHIAEFASASHCAKVPALATRKLAPGKLSEPFRGRFVRVSNRGTSDAALAFSDDPRKPPVADENSLPLAAGATEYFEVEPGTHLHFILL